MIPTTNYRHVHPLYCQLGTVADNDLQEPRVWLLSWPQLSELSPQLLLSRAMTDFVLWKMDGIFLIGMVIPRCRVRHHWHFTGGTAGLPYFVGGVADIAVWIGGWSWFADVVQPMAICRWHASGSILWEPWVMLWSGGELINNYLGTVYYSFLKVLVFFVVCGNRYACPER